MTDGFGIFRIAPRLAIEAYPPGACTDPRIFCCGRMVFTRSYTVFDLKAAPNCCTRMRFPANALGVN